LLPAVLWVVLVSRMIIRGFLFQSVGIPGYAHAQDHERGAIMERFSRWLDVLPFAACVVFGACLIAAASRAGAQSLPATAESQPSEKLQFKLPYDTGKTYLLKQTTRLEARTGEYRPDDLTMDIRQIVTATVRRDANAPALLKARIGHVVQRGGNTGRHYEVNCARLDVPPDTRHDNNWKHEMLFLAAMNEAGKLSNSRGSADVSWHRDSNYINHPSVVAKFARRDDWVRQIVEEPMLYLPPGKVAVGEKWTYVRTLRAVGELSIYPAKTIREDVRCTLAAVADTPRGRVATIEVASVIGDDAPGKTCLRKAGMVRYNLDGGELVQHKLTLTGILIRSHNKPLEIKAEITVSLLPCGDKADASAPAAEGEAPGRACLPAGLPALDRDGEEVFVFDRGTKVVQDHNGKVRTLMPKPTNPDAAEKQAKLAYPVEINDPRKGVTGKGPRTLYREMMMDLAGRAWWRKEGDQTILTWIEDGKYQERKIEGHYSNDTIRFPRVHGVTGHDLYVDAGGEVFASGKKKLHIYEKAGWKDMDIPCGLGEIRLAQQQDVLFRRVGRTVYVARDLDPGGMDAHCSIVAYENGVLCDTGIVLSQQATYLGQHEGKLLIGTSNRLWRFEPIQNQVGDHQALVPLIGKLFDDSYKIRKAAADELQRAGRGGVEVIHKAIDESDDPERKLRLRTVLKKFRTKPSARLIPTTLGWFEALDFVFQARGGLQFYRPRVHGRLQAEGLLLCTDGDGKIRKIDLPRRDRLFQLQLETPDGRIIGRDSQYVFELDLKTLVFRDLFALGKYGASRDTRVVAAKGGQYCLEIDTSLNAGHSVLYLWYDPAGKRRTALLPGLPIADGVSHGTNHFPDLAITPGLDGRLWLLRRAGLRECRLGFAKGPEVTTLAPRFKTDQAALFPLRQHAVLVVRKENGPALLHLGDKVIEKPNMRDLISMNYRQMLALVPAAKPYRTHWRWGERYLLRMGDDFWIKEPYAQEEFERGETGNCYSGVYGGRNWRKCDFSRVVGIDPARKKLLAYDRPCRKLFWASSEGGKPKIEPVTTREYSFGWCWYDMSNLPYYRSGMILTEQAIDRMKDKLADPSFDSEAKADDFTGFRMWDGSQWVNWDGTLFGGTLFTDETGGIWNIRQRDVLVQLKDGRRQRLDLDDAIDGDYANLVQERPGVVWLATDQSMVRLVCDCKDGVFGPYRLDRRFTTRNYGYSIRGPWIIDGKDFYFASGGVLHYVPIAELLKKP